MIHRARQAESAKYIEQSATATFSLRRRVRYLDSHTVLVLHVRVTNLDPD
jgi:hypothetical protein